MTGSLFEPARDSDAKMTGGSRVGSDAVIETVNQAMNALDAYWAKHGTPDHRVIAQIRGRLEEHSSSCDDDWKALLDDAMRDLGYGIEWDGEGIDAITREGDGSLGIAGDVRPGS